MAEFTCRTVGELKKALESWPDEKPLIVDVDGNTQPVEIMDWAEEPAKDLNWPVAIFVR
jgi:hypothetical protein